MVHLVVEDGSGLATANTLVSEAFVDSYIQEYMSDATAWLAAVNGTKEQCILEANVVVFAVFARRWKGARTHRLQALPWPRTGIVDYDNFTVDADSLPVNVERAVAEMTYRVFNVGGVDAAAGDSSKLIPDNAKGNVASKSVKVGPITTTTAYVAGQTGRRTFRKIELMLSDFIKTGGRISRA